MNRIAIRFATAAMLGLAATQGALAYETLDAQAFFGGQARTRPGPEQGMPAGNVVVTGGGSNISVRPASPPSYAPTGYVAVVQGSGENQSVVHVPLNGQPRG